MRSIESRYFLRQGEGISGMDRNNFKVANQQEVQRRASLSQQQPSRKLTSGIQRHSSAPSMVIKDEGTQLETFQSLTFQPEHKRDLQDFCSGSYDPPQYSQRKTQTETQAQAEVFSLARRQEQTHLNTPLLYQPKTPYFQVKEITATTEREEKVCQLKEKYKSRGKFHEENSDNPHSRETESNYQSINQSLSKPTVSVSKSFREKRVRHQQMENMGETGAEDKMKSQFEFTAPHGKMAVSSSCATSGDRWEQSLQQNNTHIWTFKHPRAVYESNLVQHFNISPSLRENRVSPRAWQNQEVIVSFKTVNDHIERVSSFDMETLSRGCDETKTHFHLCQCSESRPGSSTGSNWVEGQKQATTTAPNNTSQASTPLKRSTFPMHSTTRRTSSGGSSSEGEHNPPSQCHQFPKLPSQPPCLSLQDSHLNLSEDDYASEEGWMFPGIQKLKEDRSLGSGLVPQQQSFSSRDDKTHDGNFNIYLTYI